MPRPAYSLLPHRCQAVNTETYSTASSPGGRIVVGGRLDRKRSSLLTNRVSEGRTNSKLVEHSRHLVDLLTTLLSSTFRQILWKQALDLDLNSSQAQLLFYVAKNPGALMSEAARSFGITLPAVTQVVDRLEAKGFLRRVEDTRDRRQVRLSLTRDGEGLARELEALQVKGLARVLKRLSPADRKDVIRGLERLVSATRGEL